MSQGNDINNLFNQMLTHWEDITNDMSQNLMETEHFSRAQRSGLNLTLKVHEAIHKQMARSLKIANMPSRDELNDLHGAVGDLSNRLGKIERMLQTIQTGQTSMAAKGPPRTKIPPKASEKTSKRKSKDACRDG